MPVRKIPKNHLHVTGGFAGVKNDRMNGYESPLERDFMLLLDFDPEVVSFEEQPVKIPYRSWKGRKTEYPPDVLVRYRSPRLPELIEVKPSSQLKSKAKEFAPKFEAAEVYAREHGWVFRIVTEKDIEGPFLENLKFLKAYRETDPDAAIQDLIVATVGTKKRGLTIKELVELVAPTDEEKLSIFPALWRLVVTGRLTADLRKKLNSSTRLTDPRSDT